MPWISTGRMRSQKPPRWPYALADAGHVLRYFPLSGQEWLRDLARVRHPTLIGAVDKSPLDNGLVPSRFSADTEAIKLTNTGQNFTSILGATASWTVMVWARTSVGPDTRQGIIGDYNTAGSQQSVVMEFGGFVAGGAVADEINFQRRTSSGTFYTNTGIVWEANRDYHLAFTRSGSDWTAYVDGSQVGTASDSGSLNTGSGTFFATAGRFGAFVGTGLSGQVWHLSLLSRALSAGEIYARYDPATRWRHLEEYGRRTYFLPAAVGPGPTGVYKGLMLMGVGM